MKHRRVSVGTSVVSLNIRTLGEAGINVGLDVVPHPDNADGEYVYVTNDPAIGTGLTADGTEATDGIPVDDVISYDPKEIEANPTFYFRGTAAGLAVTLILD